MSMLSRRSVLRTMLYLPFAPALWAGDEEKRESSSFNIGLSDSLISGQIRRSVAPMVVQSMSEVFNLPGKARTHIEIKESPALAKCLQQSQIQLAIMTGIEYGWLGESLTGMEALAVAFTSDIRLKACVLVRSDSKFKSLLDLKDKTIAMPKRSQFHTQIFLHHEIVRLGGQPLGFFDRAIVTDDVNDGIENVVENQAMAVLVDADSWNGYQERKPGRAKKLKLIAQSIAFPTSAVLFNPEYWNDKDLQLLKQVLFTAHERAFSRQILNVWRISKFVPCSAEYQQVVKNIVREIPQPIVPAEFARFR